MLVSGFVKAGQGDAEGPNGPSRQAFCAYNTLLCQTALDRAIETFSAFGVAN
jgi:hypothetical protein